MPLRHKTDYRQVSTATPPGRSDHTNIPDTEAGQTTPVATTLPTPFFSDKPNDWLLHRKTWSISIGTTLTLFENLSIALSALAGRGWLGSRDLNPPSDPSQTNLDSNLTAPSSQPTQYPINIEKEASKAPSNTETLNAPLVATTILAYSFAFIAQSLRHYCETRSTEQLLWNYRSRINTQSQELFLYRYKPAVEKAVKEVFSGNEPLAHALIPHFTQEFMNQNFQSVKLSAVVENLHIVDFSTGSSSHFGCCNGSAY